MPGIVVMPFILPYLGRESVLVETAQALQVAQAAAQALAERARTCENRMFESERLRRQRFNASWLGRLFPFLRTSPQTPVTLQQILDLPMGSWPPGIFKFSLLMYLLEESRDLAQRAERAHQPLSVRKDDWERMMAWAAFHEAP